MPIATVGPEKPSSSSNRHSTPEQPKFVSPSKGQEKRAPSPPASWATDDLNTLRASICQPVPSNDNPYWQAHKVWVGCVSIEALSSFAPESTVKDLEIRIKAVGREGAGNVWQYFLSKTDELQKLLGSVGNEGRVVIRDVRFLEGSLEIILIIAFIKAAIGIGGVVLALMQAFAGYDKTKAGFQDAIADCKSFVEKVRNRIVSFFEGFGGSSSPAGA